jgi:hypothetical protein
MPWGISLKQQRKGVFDPLLYRKHALLYRRHIARLPIIYYAALASLFLAAIGMAAGVWWLVVGGLGLWMMITALFTYKRLRNTSHRPSHVVEMLVTSSLIPILSIYWRIRGAWRYRVFQV